MLPTMALFFIFSMCSYMMMPLLPVVVMKMSPNDSTSSSFATWKPSIAACRAQIGSISVMMVRAPAACIARADPLPTSPNPQITAVLPASMTSVARMMPSGSECLHPYRLSNLDLVHESFTLMAVKSSEPFFSISYRRCTPVVVSSDTPTQSAAILVHFCGSSLSESAMMRRMHLNSSLSVDSGSGTLPVSLNSFSRFTPSWIRSVASPPSSTIIWGPLPSGHVSACTVHHQYSSSVSPFHANTLEVFLATTAAAA
mmetsp:Transcript_37046/g.74982  ORF Transcript_37046/g.74982 Transcript_37046/m.74982 type:complete len:256 (-) Transcript_37046:279-1046(-)